jgi:UDP-glucose 4-epimerase
MKILFTGASSFTGFWFVKELIKEGHQIFTTYTKSNLSEYQGIRKERVETLSGLSEQIFNCQFGSSKFIELIQSEKNWDLLCHHAAEVTNYKSPDFDYILALNKNTFNLQLIFERLINQDCKRIILTGSVFENDEGKGSNYLEAFSPYGLSKGLTYSVFRYYSQLFKMQLGKFVIPNPFGPYEESRFTTYLIRNWLNKKAASVNSPDYVRDNIHITLLARVYAYFINKLKNTDKGLTKINPSGYVETQGEFAERFAVEMRKRFALKCKLELHNQIEFTEPKVRSNLLDAAELISDWNEKYAWDELADYYKSHLKVKEEN